jgi:hypothetical protein
MHGYRSTHSAAGRTTKGSDPNASFGKRGYDLRQAMEDRLEKLKAIALQ